MPVTRISSRGLSTIHRTATATPLRGATTSRQPLSPFRPQLRGGQATRTTLRGFVTTPATRQAILNPRKDEDGNEMNIEITPRAAHVSPPTTPSPSPANPLTPPPSQRLKQIMTTDKNPDLALRVSVESGGCHGFQYLMSLTDLSKISQEEDTVFEGRDGAKVVMDEPSLDLLKGSKVDYTMELIGSQFKIVDNPLATSSCGCGTSFDIKA